MVKELPLNVPLTALLSEIAIAGAFSDQSVVGVETPQEIVGKMRRATMESDRRLLQQELTFYHGMAAAIEEDYRQCGFFPAFKQDVQSRRVFHPSVITVKDAIEERIGSFWQKMMDDSPAVIRQLKGEMEAGYRRIMEQGVQAGVELGDEVIHDNRLVETVVCMHHMVGRVGEMLQRGGYDVTLFQG